MAENITSVSSPHKLYLLLRCNLRHTKEALLCMETSTAQISRRAVSLLFVKVPQYPRFIQGTNEDPYCKCRLIYKLLDSYLL